jgi:hypothetical protein
LVELEVVVEPAPPAALILQADSDVDDVPIERVLTPLPSPTYSRKPQTQHSSAIVGCTSFVGEPGLYEIDAGILNEPKTWNLSGVVGDCLLVGAGVKASEMGWVSMKRTGADTIQVKLTPQYAGDTGGFFAAYFVVPHSALIRIKMEVVMRETDEILVTPSVLLPSGNESLPFQVSPKSIVSGRLYQGRKHEFLFLLFNRHPTSPLVFQLNAIGIKGGMQAWFSIAGIDEEHRRVTIMPNSCMRLALNIIVPEVQNEDFSDLEVTVACRHLRNSRETLIVQLPKQASSPLFALSETRVKVGDIIRIEPMDDERWKDHPLVVVGPEWVRCSTSTDSERDIASVQAANEPIINSSTKKLLSSGLVRARLKIGEGFKIESADAPATLTVYSALDSTNHLSVQLRLGNSYVVPPGGANLWRDAIELELARACVSGEFSCPADIVFQELLELLRRDPGGRGSSIVAVYFRLCFSDPQMENQALREKREMFIEQLKSLPETLLVNLDDL